MFWLDRVEFEFEGVPLVMRTFQDDDDGWNNYEEEWCWMCIEVHLAHDEDVSRVYSGIESCADAKYIKELRNNLAGELLEATMSRFEREMRKAVAVAAD